MESKKKIMIAILAALLIFTAGGSLLWYELGKRAISPLTGSQISEEKQTNKFQLKELSQESYKLLKQAAKEKKPDLCDKFILGLDRDYCLLYIFQVNAKVSVCQLVVDRQLKQDCFDLDLYNQAITTKEINACNKINNTEYKNECQKIILHEFSKTEDCNNQTGEIKSLCESAVYYKIAMKEKKPELCDTITEAVYKTDCQTNLKELSADQDQDGLSDDYEVSLGTSPFKADSDGDGVNDGDEMKNRRNPMIKGK